MLIACSSLLLEGQTTDYLIGPRDILAISVYGQADLTGRFTVGADGTFTFPLIGRVQAQNVTPRMVEQDIAKRLGDGLYKNPQVSVNVETYASQVVFVVGEVRQPGSYPLTGDTNVLAILARAGSTTPAAAGEILLVRARAGQPGAGPTLPDGDEGADVARIDLSNPRTNASAQRTLVRNGDTIFVPKAESVFVFGQVRTPGAYPIQKGTTVLQALALAGGLTEQGSTSRLKLVRTINDKQTSITIKLTDIVRGGDTIIVPERFF
jgi:polysaccharide biosynthesis/export protein